ncbi:sensor histidine kinase [Streptomyces sp. NPDC057539]|uniref:sensor histidine kinase n=1 Tax=Streptomyces sp. NPDC057539 TaxID=3346159 RepID=UPI0036C19EE2
MTPLSRASAAAVMETTATLLLVATLVLEIAQHSLHAEAVLCLAAGVIFLVAAALSPEARRSWLAIISGISLVIAVALLVRIADAPLLNGLHLVPLTLIASAAALGHRSDQRRGSLERERTRARRDGEERERRHWARELHDDTLQELGAVQIVLAGATASSRPDVMKDAIEQARRLISNQITSLRHLIAELRPAALDQLGLHPALEALCRSTSENFGIEAELRVGADWDRFVAKLTPEAQVHVYRIVQEAVTNAVKHAEPTRILVELDSDEHTLSTKVTDDGRGMRPEPASATMRASTQPTALGGMGMTAMRERAHLLDGHLTVDSAPGQGTRVTLRMPRHGREGRRNRSRRRSPERCG